MVNHYVKNSTYNTIDSHILTDIMKIGILSDTHDRMAGIDSAFEIFSEEAVEMIVHCGDWTNIETVRYFAWKAAKYGAPVRGVLGNNDKDAAAFLALAAEKVAFRLNTGILRFTVEDKTISVYHGHHKPTLKKLLLEDSNVLCLGHSHKPRYDRIDNKIILNPGSTAFSIPRSKNFKGSIAIYDTVKHEADFRYFAA